MVWIGFICILQTNIVLGGRYWDFKKLFVKRNVFWKSLIEICDYFPPV